MVRSLQGSIYRQYVNVLQLLCQIDISFCDSPDCLHVNKSRVVWRHDKVEAWAKLSCEQHGIEFIKRLLHEQKVTDHNIEWQAEYYMVKYLTKYT